MNGLSFLTRLGRDGRLISTGHAGISAALLCCGLLFAACSSALPSPKSSPADRLSEPAFPITSPFAKSPSPATEAKIDASTPDVAALLTNLTFDLTKSSLAGSTQYRGLDDDARVEATLIGRDNRVETILLIQTQGSSPSAMFARVAAAFGGDAEVGWIENQIQNARAQSGDIHSGATFDSSHLQINFSATGSEHHRVEIELIPLR